MKSFKSFILILIAFCLSGCLVGFLLTRKTDQNHISGAKACELRMHQCQILMRLYLQQNGRLPDSLVELGDPKLIACPVTLVNYNYLWNTNDDKEWFVIYDEAAHDDGFTVCTDLVDVVRIDGGELSKLTNVEIRLKGSVLEK